MALPTITNNSPSAGHIAWNDFVVKYDGVSYEVDAGSTDERWVWWEHNAGTPSIEAGATIPSDLTDDDLVLFKNQDGLGVRIQATSLVDGELLVDGTVLAEAVAANQINSTHIVTVGLDAGVIKFGEMSGERISAESITAIQLGVNAVVAEKISAGAVTALKIASETLTAEHFSTVIALVNKKIAVGDNISLDTTDGFKIITDEGIIQFPADGGRPSMLGDLTALSAIFMGDVDMRGDTNFVSGMLQAASGVAPPSTGPTLSNYWPHQKTAAGDGFRLLYSMTEEGTTPGEAWALCINGNNYEIRSLLYGATASTLVRTLGTVGAGAFATTDPSMYQGGLASIYNQGTGEWERFLLCNDWRYALGEVNKVYKYNEDFSVKLAEFTLTLPGLESWENAVIGPVWDTTGNIERLGVAWTVSATNKVSFRRYTTAGVASEAVVTSAWTTSLRLTFMHQYFDTDLMMGLDNNLRSHHPLTLARQVTQDYKKPPVIGESGTFVAFSGVMSSVMLGLAYGFYDYDQTMWYMSEDRAKVTLYSKYGFYDGDAGGVYGAGGETTPSPSKSLTKEIGAWMRIDTAKAPDTGDPDDPDRISYYLSHTDSNYELQGYGGVGENATFLRKVETGTAPPLINSWDSRPGNSGRLRSLVGSLYGGLDTGIWDLNGTGAGRVGPLAWNTAGKDLSKTVRELGSYTRATSGSVIANGTESNIASVTVLLRAGYRYRAKFNGTFLNGTAGQGILVKLKYGTNVTVAGTVFLEHMVDFRTTGRAQGTMCYGYFDWSGADTTVNVVAVMEGSGGTAQSYAATDRRTYFTVDEVSI